MSGNFKHIDLRLVQPEYNSKLTDVVMELQYLRRQRLGGTTPPPFFFQLKDFFHLLESINSARIEGNRTTIAEAVEARIAEPQEEDEGLREITNMEAAMQFIEDCIEETTPISQAFVLELHKQVVAGLTREGDRTPGAFRTTNVGILNSSHAPPESVKLIDYLEEFFEFINAPPDPKLDLLRVAVAHHRFAWVHPFNNGNGRVVRLLTYAMLIARGFNVRTGRILNPSAVFCSDRQRYYNMLGRADSGREQDQLAWCEYVLEGLAVELKKIDALLDYAELKKLILLPAIRFCEERKVITSQEASVLRVGIEKIVFQASDIKGVTKGMIPAARSRLIAQMRENRLIEPVTEKARKYHLCFSRSLLSRGLIHALSQGEFINLDQ